MEIQYYLAEKGCSLVLQERLLLAVDGNKVRIDRGEARDRFGFNKEGRIACLTWDGFSMPYIIIGPLAEEQVKDLIKIDEVNFPYSSGSYFTRLPRRMTSARMDIGGRI
jgi:hypothetical protein